MYLVTIFRIDSEIRFQDAISQEIDHRVVKQFDTLAEAQCYIEGVKNRMLMFNFPFAMVQNFEPTQNAAFELMYTICDQWLYNYDEASMAYAPNSDLSCLSMATRRKLHNFEEEVRLAC